MMSTRTGVRALVMVTLCYGTLEIVGLLLLLLLCRIRAVGGSRQVVSYWQNKIK